MKPLIGLTTGHFSSGHFAQPDHDVQGVLHTYIEAVLGAGGLPVLIPLSVTGDDLRALYARLDGVLLPGGCDIDPAYFNEARSPNLGVVDGERDRVELAVARLALADGKPLLGVCRGMQVMNVALGGSLYQDLPSEYGGPLLRHAHPVEAFPREHLAHPVRVEAGSQLARVLGAQVVQVNSRHHQAIKAVAPQLRVVARAPDGVIEGIEKPDHPFALGVQWHPENLQAMPEMKRLFEAFVVASSKG
ncbi:MAG: gamma-glutamyl-gamma-aminobutyrate hydrolase family protein [Anaerolineales bacterium]|nr:gamma-glutamyl-gamma-aminobutyrate hydrolase family protein [Anaerolineales bacterium]